jgi:LacI family transcriptional regulator
MRDIAKAVGTSAVTVSKAMAGKPGMSDELRKTILKKASEMGYAYPHSRLLPREHLEIGILIPDRYFEPDSFYAEIYKRLVKKVTDLGHFGLLELLDPENEKELTLPSLLTTKKVDGLIMLGEPSKAYYRKAAQAGTPVVFLDFYDEQANADAVAGDNAYGTYRLTSHLIRRGHRKIGFVGNIKATSSIMDRFLGYYRAMLTHNLPVRPDWIIPDRKDNGELIPIELPEELPTAFVCNCDVVAMALIRALNEHGYRVPEDVSVTGFDDFVTGPEPEIRLSTFKINTPAMIELAVKTMAERCSGAHGPFGRTVISGQPVYRDSEIPLENGETEKE